MPYLSIRTARKTFVHLNLDLKPGFGDRLTTAHRRIAPWTSCWRYYKYMRFGIGEYSLPGRNSARFDAMQEFISALFRVIPNFGDDLTARLKRLSASASTDPRIL